MESVRPAVDAFAVLKGYFVLIAAPTGRKSTFVM
jgi:hypothetical protein